MIGSGKRLVKKEPRHLKLEIIGPGYAALPQTKCPSLYTTKAGARVEFGYGEYTCYL